MYIYIYIPYAIWFRNTSSTAQGGGGSFKNRKPIGEACCCGAKMAERTHWWIERWLCVSAFLFFSFSCSLSLSFGIYLQSYLASTHAGLQRMLRHAMNYGCGTQPVLTREFCQIKNASACELAPAWTSKQQSDFINYRSICLSIDLSISLCIYLSLHVSIYASIDVSIYLSIYLSISVM